MVKKVSHSLVDHLGERVGAGGELGPASMEADLVYGADEPPSRLGDVDHVRHEGEPLQLQLGDVGLEENVDLGTWLLHALLDRDGGLCPAASTAPSSPPVNIHRSRVRGEE